MWAEVGGDAGALTPFAVSSNTLNGYASDGSVAAPAPVGSRVEIGALPNQNGSLTAGD
jgi:hypothetical protein